jgi:hypothetical protein
MCKPRDFDGELKALQDKARDLKSRKVLGLGDRSSPPGQIVSAPMNSQAR